MPELLFVVPCRTFSNDAETGALSIVELLDQVTINTGNGANAGREGVVPAPWAIVTLWKQKPEDVGKRFEQRLSLVSAEGKVFFANTSEFELTALKHRMTLRINGFPVAGPGIYSLKVDVRPLKATEWQEKGAYPVEVAIG